MILENMCEEFEFELANYFKLDPLTKTLSCKGQPASISGYADDEKMTFFLKKSREMVIEPGDGVIQNCWKTEKAKWIPNAMCLNQEEFPRKLLANDLGLRTLLIVPYIIDDTFRGCIEFYALEEWEEIPEMMKKINYYTTIDNRVRIDKNMFKT